MRVICSKTVCRSVILPVAFLLAGCMFTRVKEESEFSRVSNILVGTVSGTASSDGAPIVVAAYVVTGGVRRIVHHTTLHEPGPYELIVSTGRHSIVSFVDWNRNLTYDEGEPAGQILGDERIAAPAGGVVGNLNIVLAEDNSSQIDLPVGTKIPSKAYRDFHSTCPGAIFDMDDELFSDAYGSKGLWTALEFFAEISGNVYFLEEYDPEKIPILFIHGAAGSPQNFRALVDSIDRTKYQPWFFFYPSGSSIDSMAYLLLWKLQNLKMKYDFQELCITAHSMGGLVGRSFLVNYGALFPSIKQFISISTPWGGEELAELGVKYAPAVIPVWRDIQPGSAFLQSIHSREMPPTVEHYLFFGHKGNRNILRPNNDKAVTLASQLDQRSQQDAKMIYGFDEDHVSILSSAPVLSQYNALLEDLYRRSTNSDSISGNRLHVDFTYDIPADQARPLSGLYLHAVDGENADAWVYIDPDSGGKEHGPFPSGKYEVSLLATAFAPEPVRIPVEIEEGKIPRVEFVMRPIGQVRGYVMLPRQGHIDAGTDLTADESDVRIKSIRLVGNGVSRIITPLQDDVNPALFAESYLSGVDYACNGSFFFFKLPKGEYELTIEADGCRPHSEICSVTPGDFLRVLAVELTGE